MTQIRKIIGNPSEVFLALFTSSIKFVIANETFCQFIEVNIKNRDKNFSMQV